MFIQDWSSEKSEWRDAWFKQDFSWSGLAKKSAKTEGSVWNTVQEYWRVDLKTGEQRTDEQMLEDGELVEFDGARWHKAHLPIRGRSPQYSKKYRWEADDWEELEKSLADRIEWSIRQGHRKGGLALFEGVVLRDFPRWDQAASPTVFFGWACFIQDASLEGRRADFLVMNHALFGGRAKFRELRVLDQLQCIETIFRGKANFNGAILEKGGFLDKARFDKGGWFHWTTFGGQTSFDDARFEDYAGFVSARFLRDAHFINSIMLRRTNFSRAQFAGAPRLQAASLHEDVVFDGIEFPQYVWAQWAAFVLATLAMVFALAFEVFSSETTGFASVVTMLIAFVAAAGLGGILRVGGESLAAGLGIHDLDADVRAFRKLALLAEHQRNRRHAALFHRMELKAQRLRSRTDPFERFFSWLYDVLGGYGESIWRPVLAASVGGFLFAVCYWVWATSGGDWRFLLDKLPAVGRTTFDPDFVSSLQFSVENMVRPFSVWVAGEPTISCRFVDQLLAQENRCSAMWATELGETQSRSHSFAVRAVASTQTVLSLTLLFLFGLSLKRKFQVGG